MKPNAAVQIFLQKWNIRIWDDGPKKAPLNNSRNSALRKAKVDRSTYEYIGYYVTNLWDIYSGDTREQHEENHFYHHNSEASQM